MSSGTFTKPTVEQNECSKPSMPPCLFFLQFLYQTCFQFMSELSPSENEMPLLALHHAECRQAHASVHLPALSVHTSLSPVLPMHHPVLFLQTVWQAPRN